MPSEAAQRSNAALAILRHVTDHNAQLECLDLIEAVAEQGHQRPLVVDGYKYLLAMHNIRINPEMKVCLESTQY